MHRIHKLLLLTRCSHLAFLLLCLAGLVYQSLDISQTYFKYATVTRLSFVAVQDDRMPSCSLCVRYRDLLNYHHDDERRKNTSTRAAAQSHIKHSQLTVQEIFDKTPPVSDSIKSVVYRDAHMYQMQRADGLHNVSAVFQVIKYYTQDFMCYQFFPVSRSIVPFRMITGSLLFPNTIYRLDLGDALASADLFQATFFNGEGPLSTPAFSRLYSAPIQRQYDHRTGLPTATLFKFSFFRISLSLLPVPFDTGCGDVYRTVCLKTCYLKKFTEMSRAPHNWIITNPVDLLHVDERDLMNQTSAARIMKADDDCQSWCQMSACAYTISFTLPRGAAKSRRNPRSFRIVLETPYRPQARWESIAKLDLIAFLGFLCGCLATWLGVHALALDPFAVWLRRHQLSLSRKHAAYEPWKRVPLPA